jgi:hypothetical protein
VNPYSYCLSSKEIKRKIERRKEENPRKVPRNIGKA